MLADKIGISHVFSENDAKEFIKYMKNLVIPMTREIEWKLFLIKYVLKSDLYNLYSIPCIEQKFNAHFTAGAKSNAGYYQKFSFKEIRKKRHLNTF